MILEDRGWNPEGPIQWKADTEDRAVILWVENVPLLFLRRNGRRWIFENTKRSYESVQLAADAAEYWLYELLGPSDSWAEPARLELLGQYTDFLVIRDDEPRRMNRKLEQRLEATAAPAGGAGGYRPGFEEPIS